MKTYPTSRAPRAAPGPRHYRTHKPTRTRTTPPPGERPTDHAGAAFLAIVAFIVLFGLSILFRYINPDPTIHHEVDPNAPVVERPTFHDIH